MTPLTPPVAHTRTWVLAEQRAAVVDDEGRDGDALGVVARAQVERGAEGGQEAVVHFLGGEGGQAQVAAQRLQLQVPQDDGLVGACGGGPVCLRGPGCEGCVRWGRASCPQGALRISSCFQTNDGLSQGRVGRRACGPFSIPVRATDWQGPRSDPPSTPSQPHPWVPACPRRRAR